MARKSARRKSFWLGHAESLTLDGEGATGLVTLATDALLADIDPTPTLIRIRGRILVTCAREAPIALNAASTAAAEWGVGLMCQEAVADLTSPLDDLGDERWLWTQTDGCHAVATALQAWNGSAFAYEYTQTHMAPYPRIHEVDSRAKRKFEDPCNLCFHAHTIVPFGNDPFEDVQFSIRLRTLWLAS